MTSLSYSRVIDELTRRVIAADMSCSPTHRGMGRSNPQLLEWADRILHSNSMLDKRRAEEGQAIANAVWYDCIKPRLLEALNSVCVGPKHAEQVLDQYFSDKGLEYRDRGLPW